MIQFAQSVEAEVLRRTFLNDLQGAIGEIIALGQVIDAGITDVTHDLVCFDGPVDDVDLIITHAERKYRMETKCVLLEDNKNYFSSIA